MSVITDDFRYVRTVDEFVSYYRKFGVRMASKALQISPALKSTKYDETDAKLVEPIVDACGFEIANVEIWRNQASFAWFVIRLVAKG